MPAVLADESLRSLVDGLRGILWEADPDSLQFSFVSAAAERLLGFPTAAWLEPEFVRRHTHPEDLERWFTACRAAVRDRREQALDYRMIAQDGKTVWLHATARPLPSGGLRLVGVTFDITAQKERDAQRARRDLLHGMLVEHSPDGLALLAADGTTVFQSPAISRHLGFAADDLVGRQMLDLVHADDRELVARCFRATFEIDAVRGPIRFRMRTQTGGWRTMETVSRRVFVEKDVPLVLCNTRDVTAVVEAQAAVEAGEEQLRHALKMEAVGRLAGGVAHDFNNLLTVISGYAELLAASLDPGDARSADLGEITSAAHRASLLTRQLITFSRTQVLRPEILELNGYVRAAAAAIRRLLGEGIRVSVATAAVPLPVLVDRSQLDEVLLNLAVNARDAMPLGGSLTIVTGSSTDSALLTVEDTGSGMAPEILQHIFEPFFTTKELGKGTGLGLSTAYGIVHQSGGEIDVSSQAGQGTTFRIRLPLARQRRSDHGQAVGDLPRGDETILVVDEDTRLRDLVQQVLRRQGYVVLAATDMATASDLCCRHGDRISLLLTGMVLPQVSGPDIFKQVAMLVPGVAVLYISAHAGDDTPIAPHSGVGFLQKPFTPAALARKVREALDLVRRVE